MPLLLLLLFLVDLLSVALLFLGYHLWREWDYYHDLGNDGMARTYLIALIAVSAYVLFGRHLLSRLLSKRRPGEIQPQRFDSPEREVVERPDGTKINVEYFGNPDGQPIVFVHGWASNKNNWFYQRRHFEKDFRLIMMDLPGLGKSTRPDNRDFSLPKMASDLAAVIEKSAARHPVLWGHSIGGMTILTLLAGQAGFAAPAVRGAILEHTTYTNPVKTTAMRGVMTALQKPVLVPLCYLMIALSPLLWLLRWLSYFNGHSQLMTRFSTFAGTQTYRQLDFTTFLSTLASPAVVARGVLGMFQYDVTRALPSIDVPTLLIAANQDLLTQPDASAYMQQHLGHAELVTVAPANHEGLVERHSEVNAAAERFIRGLR